MFFRFVRIHHRPLCEDESFWCSSILEIIDRSDDAFHPPEQKPLKNFQTISVLKTRAPPEEEPLKNFQTIPARADPLRTISPNRQSSAPNRDLARASFRHSQPRPRSSFVCTIHKPPEPRHATPPPAPPPAPQTRRRRVALGGETRG